MSIQVRRLLGRRARGKFRNRGQKPLVGDFCSFQEEKDGSSYILTLEKKDITNWKDLPYL